MEILHYHADASDGTETLAAATPKRGYEDFGVADHLQSAQCAGRLSVEQLETTRPEADPLSRRFSKDFRILKGIESDIYADRSLDYDEDVLEQSDFVLASIHGRFRLDHADGKPDNGDFESSYNGHRPYWVGTAASSGYEIDVEKVLRACARHDVAVEINAHPRHRLALAGRPRRAGCARGDARLSGQPNRKFIMMNGRHR